MKTYVITVSRFFPTTHKRKGEPTYFPEKLTTGIVMGGNLELAVKYNGLDLEKSFDPKIHTIRSNYPFWEKRIKEIQKGNAILSIRYWSGKPYNSKQVEICQLDKDSGIGIQQMYFHLKDLVNVFVDFNTVVDTEHLSENDGLSIFDFKEWFKKYDLSKTMAIIHFTKFRY